MIEQGLVRRPPVTRAPPRRLWCASSLPDGQELTARFSSRRQLFNGWVYLVGRPVHSKSLDGAVEASEYRARVRAFDGCLASRTTPFRPSAAAAFAGTRGPGPRQPSGWVTVSAGGSRGAGSRTVLHAQDCVEAPPPVHVLSLEEALNVAERPATRLCVLCCAAQELKPMLRGFDHIGAKLNLHPFE